MAAVTVVYPGATAEDMESLVCEKVEETVTTLDGFDYCNSDITDLLDVAKVIVATSGENISEDELTERTEGLKNALKVVDGVKKSL